MKNVKSHSVFYLFLLLLTFISVSFPIAFSKARVYQDNSHHNDHLNDASDGFPNDYTPLVIPIENGKWITVAPVITCTIIENGTCYPYYYPCKMAQTILVDDDWSDGSTNYTYIFEDWNDYDWNDIIVNFYTSIFDGISSDMFLAFREAAWKNPFTLEITAEGTWMKIEWNSTDYPDMHSLTIGKGETVEIDIFVESNLNDEAFVRFMIPPFASFSWYPQQLFAGENVVFDASASYDPDKEIETYSWVFGDGSFVDTDNQTIIHSFTSPGTYVVNLTVIDSDGLTDVVSKRIEVLAIIGGKTSSLGTSFITIWRNANMLLTIVFGAMITLARRKLCKFVE